MGQILSQIIFRSYFAAVKSTDVKDDEVKLKKKKKR